MLPHSQTSSGIKPVSAQGLMQKIQTLPPERLAEVDDFVEFLRLRMEQAQAHAQDRSLARMAAQASEPSFASVWDNTEDEAYDAL